MFGRDVAECDSSGKGETQQINRIIEYEPDGTDQAQRFEKLLGPSSVGFFAEPTLKLINIWGQSKESFDEAKQLIQRFYKPKPALPTAIKDRNAEITLHILLGMSGSAEPSDAPPVLNTVVAQLRQLTTLTTFRDLKTQIVRVREGKRLKSSGVLNRGKHPAGRSEFWIQSSIQNWGKPVSIERSGGELLLRCYMANRL